VARLRGFYKGPGPNPCAQAAVRAHLRYSREHGIGSFCRLDRQHMTARYHHRLSDIEVSCGAQVIETQRDVGAVLLGGLRMTECAFGDQNIRRNLMSADKAETLILESLAHAGQEMIVAAAIGRHHPSQDAEPF